MGITDDKHWVDDLLLVLVLRTVVGVLLSLLDLYTNQYAGYVVFSLLNGFLIGVYSNAQKSYAIITVAI